MVETCLNDISGAAVNYEKQEASSTTEFQHFAHVTIMTPLFGFIDDMYINISTYEITGVKQPGLIVIET